MREIKGDLFNPPVKCDAICITTNGVVKRDGRAVMGAGCAKQAKGKWPMVDAVLGECLAAKGNITQCLTDATGGCKPVLIFVDDNGQHWAELPYHLITFPTKNHWKDPSDLKLIEWSAYMLSHISEGWCWERVVLPRPGCGLGQLNWEEQVKPMLADILDDRFYIITHK